MQVAVRVISGLQPSEYNTIRGQYSRMLHSKKLSFGKGVKIAHLLVFFVFFFHVDSTMLPKLHTYRYATLRQCYACVRPNARQCNAPKCNHDRGSYFFSCYLLLGCSASMTAAGRLLEHFSFPLRIVGNRLGTFGAGVARLVQIHFLYCYCVCRMHTRTYS